MKHKRLTCAINHPSEESWHSHVNLCLLQMTAEDIGVSCFTLRWILNNIFRLVCQETQTNPWQNASPANHCSFCCPYQCIFWRKTNGLNIIIKSEFISNPKKNILEGFKIIYRDYFTSKLQCHLHGYHYCNHPLKILSQPRQSARIPQFSKTCCQLPLYN